MSMALEYLNHTPRMAFRKLERDLRLVNPQSNLRRFKDMTPRALGEEIARLDAHREETLRESTYGAWLTSEEYVENQLLKEALVFLKEYKEGRRDEEVLVPGFTYYRRVKQFGESIRGHRCHFRKGNDPLWTPFKENINVLKAFELLRHGSEEDFKTIYIEMADGRLDALQNISLEHIAESSEAALREIGEFCDTRWKGPWAWETPSPYSLRESIEDRKNMTPQTVNEMQAQFEGLLVALNEETMDKYEVIAAGDEMAETIGKMVEQIARLGGEGIIKLKSNIRLSMGDDAANSIEDKFLEPIRAAAEALSQLQATIVQTMEKLKAGDETMGAMAGVDAGMDAVGDAAADGLGGDTVGDELGTPADAMAGDALGNELGGPDDLGDTMAGAELGGDDGERPMKAM